MLQHQRELYDMSGLLQRNSSGFASIVGSGVSNDGDNIASEWVFGSGYLLKKFFST
jgi:hypothetical protein